MVTNDVLDASVESWRCVPLARVVATIRSLLPMQPLHGMIKGCLACPALWKALREARCSEHMSCKCEGVLGMI